jgi:L-ascorbate metabolism protein UlaG (beta-lactamase superfamily)
MVEKMLIIISGTILLFAVAGLVILSHPAFGLWRHRSTERIQASPNYYDGMFQNQEPTPHFTGDSNGPDAKHRRWKMLKRFMADKDSVRIPTEPIEAVKTDLRALPTDEDWLVWFGHSSYLFCLNGLHFLVDPILQPEWPSSMMLKAFPGTDIYRPNDLPEIDVLIVTHEHWDHMDYATLRDIRTKVKYVVCPLGIADYLRYWGYSNEQIAEMDWAESLCRQTAIRDTITITCLPSRHFSNRLLGKRNQTLWASFMIEAAGRKVYIGGDGGYDKRFREIHERFGSIDLAFLENGQYNANWKYIHTTPEDLEKVTLDLQAKQVFTVHHDKYSLAMHPWYEPDSVAHNLATRHNIHLLDAPIGTVVSY